MITLGKGKKVDIDKLVEALVDRFVEKEKIILSKNGGTVPSYQTKAERVAGANLNSAFQVALRSGDYTVGFKTTLKNIMMGRTKLVIMANNLPILMRSQVEYLAMLAKIGVQYFHGDCVDLGTACGKNIRVSIMANNLPILMRSQ